MGAGFWAQMQTDILKGFANPQAELQAESSTRNQSNKITYQNGKGKIQTPKTVQIPDAQKLSKSRTTKNHKEQETKEQGHTVKRTFKIKTGQTPEINMGNMTQEKTKTLQNTQNHQEIKQNLSEFSDTNLSKSTLQQEEK